MDDLIAFLKARLEEDEAGKREIHEARVCSGCSDGWDAGFDPDRCDCGHPARVLREVKALRAILAACDETLQGEDSHDYLTDGGSGEEYELARFVIRQLAAVWSDHPEWKP